jgi:hypothetical protein
MATLAVPGVRSGDAGVHKADERDRPHRAQVRSPGVDVKFGEADVATGEADVKIVDTEARLGG